MRDSAAMPKTKALKKPEPEENKARMVARNLVRIIDASPDKSVNAFANRTRGSDGKNVLNQPTLRRIIIGEISPTELI